MLRLDRMRPSLAARVLIALVRLYQRTLSHLVGGHCRFTPSCSHYAIACLQRFGAIRGTYYTARRLWRCQPFYPGGYDPPPPDVSSSTSSSTRRASSSPASR